MEHLLEVLEVLVRDAGVVDDRVLVAAVLHGTLEDTARAAEEIESRFGTWEVELVRWVTKPAPGPDEDRAAARTRYLESLRDSPRDAVLITLADRMSNVQNLHTIRARRKQASYYRETCEFVAPLAENTPWFDELYRE